MENRKTVDFRGCISACVTFDRFLGRSWPRSAAIALAFMTLSLRALVPSGFMLADQPKSQGYPVVICTGHGTMALDASADHKAPAQKSKPDTPCAFAGAAAPTAPILATFEPAIRAVSEPSLVALPLDQVPGSGLAAPPPPSVGPPTLLT